MRLETETLQLLHQLDQLSVSLWNHSNDLAFIDMMTSAGVLDMFDTAESNDTEPYTLHTHTLRNRLRTGTVGGAVLTFPSGCILTRFLQGATP